MTWRDVRVNELKRRKRRVIVCVSVFETVDAAGVSALREARLSVFDRERRAPGVDESEMVKPHGRLVLVNSTAHTAYISSLSTSSSPTALQGLASGIPYLGGGFPLRCFQRLSFPHLATQPCHGNDNWSTRGTSFPVLSY